MEGTPPTPLDYQAAAVARPVSVVRFGRAATLLLLANTLLGGAMLLAVFFVDRLGAATWAMVAAGALLIYVTLGCMSAERPRFGRAVALGAVAAVLAGVALARNVAAADALAAEITRGKTGVVTVYFETDQGALLATLLLAWKLSAAAVIAAGALVLFAAFCLWRATRPNS